MQCYIYIYTPDQTFPTHNLSDQRHARAHKRRFPLILLMDAVALYKLYCNHIIQIIVSATVNLPPLLPYGSICIVGQARLGSLVRDHCAVRRVPGGPAAPNRECRASSAIAPPSLRRGAEVRAALWRRRWGPTSFAQRASGASCVTPDPCPLSGYYALSGTAHR